MDVVEIPDNKNDGDVEMECVQINVNTVKEKNEQNTDQISPKNDANDESEKKKEENVMTISDESRNLKTKNKMDEQVDDKNDMNEKCTLVENKNSDIKRNKKSAKNCEAAAEIVIDLEETKSKCESKIEDLVVFNNDIKNKRRRCCCNLECESQKSLLNASGCVLMYFGLKYVKGKSQKVCKYCFEKAMKHQELLAYALLENKPLFAAEFPIRKDIAFIDDSDEELSEEEPTFEADVLEDISMELSDVVYSSMNHYDIDYQIKESEAILKHTYCGLKEEYDVTDSEIDEMQKVVDNMRSTFYKAFVPKIKELPPEEIIDVPTSLSPEKKYKMFPSNLPSSYNSPPKRSAYSSPSPQDSPRRSPLVGVATKKVTQVQRTVFPGLPQIEVLHQSQQLSMQTTQQQQQQQPQQQLQQHQQFLQQEVVALEQVQQIRPTLPPMGALVRSRIAVHDVLYAMKNGYYGMWARAKVLEVLPKLEAPTTRQEYIYRIKFESRKSSTVKLLTGKQVAYPNPSPVRLPVGTRVIALFRDEWAKECYYAGIIAEPPKSMNKYRYLVFFDDGYAQYVSHEKILLVCESSRNVWDDIHPDSRDFVKGYLDQYPERPMLKLQQGQIVKTEWNGKWWIARVVEVDGSLVKMHFDADGRTELIYRGSTRLGPLYSELANADARKKFGNFGRHRMGISSLKRKNMPYVEYTRNDMEDNKHDDSGGTLDEYRPMERNLPSRAVAKKSTSKRSDSAREQLEALILSSDRDLRSGHVESLRINPTHIPRKFHPHQCGHRCIEGILFDSSQVKHYNPLVLPQLHGWQRLVTRCRGKKIVLYRTPCGRRVRSMEELHRYLRVAKSILSVDLFDFDSWVHCFSEFVMRTGFINIKDLSYGCENVPVPCVNNRDHSEPEYVKYSTVRLPMEGVNVNTDEEFLVGCNCTDDCQDKSKCACWQLTIQGTAYGPGAKVDMSVGYCYKRLREPVMSGIYECNSRCKCSNTCLNRVAQHPLQLRLQVFKTENRGWGIRCLNDVPHGAFICIYAGRLLTEQGANECVLVKGGKNYGDEYLAELDYIEVVERLKDGYESDVVEDEESAIDNIKEMKLGKEYSPTASGLSEEEEEEDGETSQDAHDSDFELDSRHQHINVMPIEESTIRTRLRNRKARNSSTDSQGDGLKDSESITMEKEWKKLGLEKKAMSDDSSSLITLSDDDDDVQREPSRFAAVSGPKKEMEKKPTYKSVREYFGDDEYCYIMDAKNDGNIGRYLNHSCTPNVFVQNVFVDTHDLRFPWVAFFALTYISAGTELTWDYNYDVGSVPGKVLHCYCGSTECRGRLL